MQFGVAAGQIDQIGLGDRIIGEGGEKADLGPGLPPTGQQVRIGESEGCITGNRDPLRRGAGRRGGGGGDWRGGFRQPQQAVQIEAGVDQCGGRVQKPLQIGPFLRLHQTQMARRVGQRGGAVECPQH